MHVYLIHIITYHVCYFSQFFLGFDVEALLGPYVLSSFVFAPLWIFDVYVAET